MFDEKIVVIGASAGGVEAMKILVSQIPPDFYGTLFLTIHSNEKVRSLLPEILARDCVLPVAHAIDQERIQVGRVYIAPPGWHMMLHNDFVILSHGARVNRHRPAIDPLFRSAAKYYGPRVIGVVLTGSQDDGTAGLIAVKRCGGIAIVQDPAQAQYPEMPQSAISHVSVDYIRPIEKIAPLLILLAKVPLETAPMENVSIKLNLETQIEQNGGVSTPQSLKTLGPLSALVCPSCHGALWEVQEAGTLRYRCHTGHGFGETSLLVEMDEAIERALWNSLRALEEKATLAHRLSERSLEMSGEKASLSFEEQAEECEENLAVIRKILLSGRL